MHTVEYQGKTYRLTSNQYDALASLGPNVADGSMTEQEAVYTVLKASGMIKPLSRKEPWFAEWPA